MIEPQKFQPIQIHTDTISVCYKGKTYSLPTKGTTGLRLGTNSDHIGGWTEEELLKEITRQDNK